VGTQWYRLPTSARVVALTFDAGGDNAGVSSILDTLLSEGVPATFFVVGRWAEVYPDDTRRIAGRYRIGNHTYTHVDLTTISDTAIRKQLADGEEALLEVTGDTLKPLFRFPFGAASDHAIEVVNSVGYGCINWTVGTRGWMGTSGGETVDTVVHAVLAGLEPGAIILMHVGANPDDHSTLDADALLRVIQGIRAAGYSFVTIEDYL
jgi:peptidoglycan/xylan/chitin deacetylase (PgdA/CDA1 family)